MSHEEEYMLYHTTLDNEVENDLPPPYEAVDARQPSNGHASYSSRPNNEIPSQQQSSNDHTLPCVIPQTRKALGGPFASPFARAYPPSFARHDISQADFLAFIDGLNEVFISHPALKGLSAAGAIMGMFYGTPVEWAGMGLQASAQISSAATSYLRTRAYIKACNADLFHKTGLHAAILSTKDMMSKIGHSEQWLRLPSLETVDDLDESNESMKDPRMQRLNGLDGYVAPLDFNVPLVTPPENLLNKMSAWQAQKTAAKHERKTLKRQEKAEGRQVGAGGVRVKDERKLDRKLAKLEKAQEEQHDGKHGERDVRRAQERYDRTEKKLGKKLDRDVRRREDGRGKAAEEERNANKIRWLVISQWEGDCEDDEAQESSSDVDLARP